MSNKKEFFVRLSVLMALLLGSVASCVTITPEPPTKESDRNLQDCEEMGDSGPQPTATIPPGLEVSPFEGLIYVEDQVIVTGPPEKIDEAFGDLGLALEYEYSFELGKQAVRLYEIEPETSVEQIVCKINVVGLDYGVFADPNYHMSPAGWVGGASPWTQNGEWVDGLDTAPASAFQTQWAFDQVSGISLYDSNGDRLPDIPTGERIRVGVFDTSPFKDLSGGQGTKSFQDLMGEAYEVLPTEQPPLTVWHPSILEAPGCPGQDRKSGDSREVEHQDISDHGLFVAGLVHAVAPASDIHLVRVLEDDGCGNLFSIAQNVDRFMTQAQIDKREGKIDGVVINLSLGVHQPPDPESHHLPLVVHLLEYVLRRAYDNDAVVVAAAGNDSFDPGPPRSMELPAGYSFVIGVAASNDGRDLGCFSNIGDVAAPGGDGEHKSDDAPCVIPDCSEHPERCVVSLVENPSPGFAYWVGTSFATPLVSGQAALLLDDEVLPGDVRNEIEGNAKPTGDPNLGAGIIDLK